MSDIFTTFGNFNNKTGADHFLLAAITQLDKSNGEYGSLQFPVEVVLTANGVDLPFRATLDNIYERFSKRCDEAIEEVRQDMVPENEMISVHKLKNMTISDIVELVQSLGE